MFGKVLQEGERSPPVWSDPEVLCFLQQLCKLKPCCKPPKQPTNHTAVNFNLSPANSQSEKELVVLML